MKKVNTCLLKLTAICCIMFLCLPSCEWDSNDDNYTYVEKIDPGKVTVNLAGVNPNEVIEIPNKSFFYYSLSTEHAEVAKQQFYLDGEPIPSYGVNHVMLNVNSEDVGNKIHNLKLQISINEKSLLGQLLTQAGEGLYSGEFNFKVRILPEQESRLKIKQSLSEDKFLRIDWQTPKGMEIDSYKVYKYNDVSSEIIITDLSKLHYIDKEYVYGYVPYVIEAVMKSKNQPDYRELFVPEYLSINQENIAVRTDKDNNYILTWNNPNPYVANYVIPISETEKVIIKDDKLEAIIPRMEYFPTLMASVDIYFLPKGADAERYKEYNSARIALEDARFENHKFNIDYAFDVSDNELYVINFDGFHVYDSNNEMKLKNRKKIIIDHTGSQIKISPSGMIGINSTDEKFKVYFDKTLSNVLLELPVVESYTFAKDRLLVRYIDSEVSKRVITLYNTATMTPVLLNNVDYYKDYELVLSPDAKHIVAKYLGGESIIKILRIETNNELTEIKSLDINTGDIVFNPINPNEVIFYSSFGGFSIFDLNTLAVKYTISAGQAGFCNIDPVSGYLLYHTNYGNPIEFIILNRDYTQEVARFKVSNLGNPHGKLYNSTFIYNNYFSDYKKLSTK